MDKHRKHEKNFNSYFIGGPGQAKRFFVYPIKSHQQSKSKSKDKDKSISKWRILKRHPFLVEFQAGTFDISKVPEFGFLETNFQKKYSLIRDSYEFVLQGNNKLLKEKLGLYIFIDKYNGLDNEPVYFQRKIISFANFFKSNKSSDFIIRDLVCDELARPAMTRKIKDFVGTYKYKGKKNDVLDSLFLNQNDEEEEGDDFIVQNKEKINEPEIQITSDKQLIFSIVIDGCEFVNRSEITYFDLDKPLYQKYLKYSDNEMWIRWNKFDFVKSDKIFCDSEHSQKIHEKIKILEDNLEYNFREILVDHNKTLSFNDVNNKLIWKKESE